MVVLVVSLESGRSRAEFDRFVALAPSVLSGVLDGWFGVVDRVSGGRRVVVG